MYFLKTIYEILDHYLFTRRYTNEGWNVKYSCYQFIQQTNQLGQCEQSASGSDCVERFGCDFGFQNLLSFKRSSGKSRYLPKNISFASLLF